MTPPKPNPKAILPIVLLVAAAVGGGIWWRNHQLAVLAATQIRANGTIEADEVEVASQRSARLARYDVAEGQSVHKGQVIAVLDTSELSAIMAQTQGAAAAAAANLADLERGTRPEEKRRAAAQVAQSRAALHGAQRSLADANLSYKRRTTLRQALDAAETQRGVAQEGVRQSEATVRGAADALKTAQEELDTSVQLRITRDNARQALETARAAEAGAQSQLDQVLNGTRSEQITAAEAAVGQADSAALAAREEMANASSDLGRTQELYVGHAVSDQQLDAAKTRAETARARLTQAEQAKDQAKARLAELRTGARPEEIATARAALQQAKAAREGSQRTYDNAQQAYELRIGARQALDAAKTQNQVAPAQLASARATLAGAELAVRNAQTAYQDALSEKLAVDTSLQAYEVAIGQLEGAQAQLEQARNGATREQIASARGQLDQAKGSLSLAKAQYEQSIIRSPIEGVLTKQVAKVGETVNPGATVAKVVPLDQAYLTMYVPLPEMGRVKLGQKVSVSADTYPGKSYPGSVTQISDTPEFTPRNVQTQDERVKQVYEVKVTVENPGRELKPGMPADAVIHL
jgi:HlyD family secretion protein